MSTKKKSHRHPPTHTPDEARPSVFSNTVLLSLSGLLAFLLAYAGWQAYRESPNASLPDASDTPPAATAATPEQLQKLLGRWVRNEGGYVLNIKSAAKDGKLDAEYLNPKSIHIARAEADQFDGKLRVFVQFQDVNYEGSTYDLRYEPSNDQLVGEYFQATQQQRYQVSFERTK